MKNIFYILLLLPTIIFAQYPSNSGQKITLGEQTTADGLVFRGVASIDTVTATSKITRANKQDTSAYILLDTVTNLLWHYKIGSNAWTQAGGGVSVSSFSAGSTGLTPSTATTGAVTLGGTLAVANGGTNTSTAFTAGSVVFAGASGTYTQDNSGLFYDNTNDRLGIGTTSPSDKITVSTAASGGNTQAKFVSTDSTASTNLIVDVENSAAKRLQLNAYGKSAPGNFLGIPRAGNSFVVKAGGKLGIGVDDDYDLLLAAGSYYGVKTMTIEQNGGFKFSTLAGSGSRTVEADLNGVISAPISSITTKENVQTLDYGLNQVLQINPVSFDYIDKNKWGEDRKLGFIVEDIFSVVPEVTGTMNNGDMYLDMVKLIPVLTKAIQEQTIIIKQLEDRILNLENK